MPWTPVHPIVVLPLLRLGSLQLNAPALVIGAMIPDGWFHLGLNRWSNLAHRWPEAFALGIGLGLVVLALLVLLRRPLCYLLPQPHRSALAERFDARWRLTCATLAHCVFALALGIATHLLLDLFTHRPPRGFAWLAWLDAPIAVIAGRVLLLHTVLQVTVSAVGGVFLLLLYRRWLRRREQMGLGAVGSGAGDRGNGWRWALQGTLLTVATAAGLAQLMPLPPLRSTAAAQGLISDVLVAATAAYVPLYLVAAMICYGVDRGRVLRPSLGRPDQRA